MTIQNYRKVPTYMHVYNRRKEIKNGNLDEMKENDCTTKGHDSCDENQIANDPKFSNELHGDFTSDAKVSMLSLDAYADSDFVGSLVDHSSTTGYRTFLVENLITRRSKKQEVVSRSSTKAEFGALAHGLTEVVWIKELLKDLKIMIEDPDRIFCNNRKAISVVHNPVQRDQMKHVNICRHWIRETSESHKISTPYIGSSE